MSRFFRRAPLLALIGFLAPGLLPVGLDGASVFAQEVTAAPAGTPDNPFGRKYPPRILNAARLQGTPPSIDGRFDDAAWNEEGTWEGDFKQQMPVEGAPPSQPTEVKILYDDGHVYMAIRAYDDPAKVHRYPGRRDDFNGYAVDVVGACFDSYNSKRTGFEFDLTAGGGKIDLILGNGEHEWDTTWDAVWDGKVAHDEKGWTAEFRIPLNQLRYQPQEEQVWGLHVWRWIARNGEEDQWQLIPRQNTGRMYQIGELHGIRNLPRSRHIEVMPHLLGKASSGPSVVGGGTDGAGAAGVDAKVGLTSNFTLDATVNPDFGQVEADPSVINLTAYETFYEEKRPFFLEGRKILEFQIEQEDQLFHSRRIGAAPSSSPPLAAGEEVTLPESSTILGAFKVTGRTEGGLSVAVLQGFTEKESVHITSPLRPRTAVVEPFGSYSVGRVHKDWDKGNTSLGAMVTSSHRWVSDPSLAFLPAQATTGGIDFTRHFANRAWVLEANGAFSRVSGDREAIRTLQTNPVHYYQRVGADHLGVDSNRTSLSGYGGSARFGRSETSRLRLSNHFHLYSPGFDLNDVGFLRQADVIANQVFLGWSEPVPRGIFREYSVQAGREDQWDFGGLRTQSSASLDVSAQFTNKWRLSAELEYDERVDTRALRGGPALRLGDTYSIGAELGSDSSRRAIVSFEGQRERALDGDTGEWRAEASLRLRPSNRLLLSANLDYTRATDDLQYVTSVETIGGARWVMGRIDQEVWGFTFRANLAVTPELTVQYYGSPFIATGRYGEFKKATDTLAAGYEDRFHRYAPAEIAYAPVTGLYRVHEAAGGPGAVYTFENPDFSFREFRSNLVARWEYKPGSSLYLVWSQGRTGHGSDPTRSFGGHWDDLWRDRSDNVFLVKASYWFSL
jgi:hypothetical protein